MHVSDGHDLSGCRLDKDVDAIGVRRVDDRKARDHVSPRTRVPAEQPCQPTRVSLCLLHTDNVGTGLLGDSRKANQGLWATIADRAETSRGQVVVIAAVEDVLRHDRQLDRCTGWACSGPNVSAWRVARVRRRGDRQGACDQRSRDRGDRPARHPEVHAVRRPRSRSAGRPWRWPPAPCPRALSGWSTSRRSPGRTR